MSSLTKTRRALCLALTGSLALAATAYAVPAGDEYLPKVPEATGQQSGGGGGGGTGDSAQSSAALPTTTASSEPTGAASGQDRNSKGEAKDEEKGKGKGKREAVTPLAVATQPASDDDGSSGLFDPVVLLIVAGVIIATVGMTLRHRAAGIEETATDGGRTGRDRGEAPSARPTPDGEIVARGDKP
jgi:hypothetical protein